MITEVILKNFKLFEKVEFKLDDAVVLAGPNNSGKSTLLQAIAAWHLGAQRWLQERGEKPPAKRKTGVPITRKEFTVVPLREMNLLWTDRRTGASGEGIKPGTPNLIEISVKGTKNNIEWEWPMEFQYANPEMIYARPLRSKTEREIAHTLLDVIKELKVVHIPPFSGIVAEEPKHDIGYQNLLIGQGRPGEIIRNLLWEISEKNEYWGALTSQMNELFTIELQKPTYAPGKPFILCEYRSKGKRALDIANVGSGSLQVLMLMAFFYARPATVLLLDEPDAHLHVILQREIYDILRKVAFERKCQLILATHSEVLIDSTDPSRIVSMVGCRVEKLLDPAQRDRLRESLKRLRNVDLILGEEIGGVLYLEGESDERILREWAKILDHPAHRFLEHPFIHHLGGRSLKEAKDHFFALRGAFPEIKGLCIIDGDNRDEPDEEMVKGGLRVVRWRRYEIENYLLVPEAIKRCVDLPLFNEQINREFFNQVPKGTDLFSEHVALTRIKASEEFIVPLLKSIKPTPSRDLYLIAMNMKPDEIHPEIREKLDAVAELVKVKS